MWLKEEAIALVCVCVCVEDKSRSNVLGVKTNKQT